MAGCDEYAELLSVRQDGELDPAEEALLDEHLADCADCDALEKRLAKVDFIIDSTDRLVGSDRVADVSGRMPRPGMRERLEERLGRILSSRSRRVGVRAVRRVGARAVQLAAAALILIAISLVILVTGEQADAGLIDPHVTALEEASAETIKNQDALLDTLEWDLNALKLEVRCTDLDDESSSRLLERIDALLQEVEKTRLDDRTVMGEEK